MAHRGKRYKLWFRRDLAVSTLNYNSAYPEAYALGFIGWTSAFFQLGRLNDTLIYNTRKDSSTVRRWTGDNTTGPGIQIRAEVEVTDTNWGKERVFYFRIFVGQIFRILEVKCTASDFTFGYEAFSAAQELEIITMDSRITYEPIDSNVYCTAAPYLRYDP